MELFKEKLSDKYSISIEQIEMLLNVMTPLKFKKGDFVVREGERNSTLYILKSWVWRSFRLNDGEEMTLWFADQGEFVFGMWGYAEDALSQTNIEIETDSEAFSISKARIDELCSSSLEMANLIRRIFESHFTLARQLFEDAFIQDPTNQAVCHRLVSISIMLLDADCFVRYNNFLDAPVSIDVLLGNLIKDNPDTKTHYEDFINQIKNQSLY